MLWLAAAADHDQRDGRGGGRLGAGAQKGHGRPACVSERGQRCPWVHETRTGGAGRSAPACRTRLLSRARSKGLHDWLALAN
jgi:hypothetical protein